MKTVMIIGAGQLGSRHLQGAIQSNKALNLIVVDPSIESLKLAKERANEIDLGNADTKIKFTQEIESRLEIEICIIATTANIRFIVFKDLINKCNVKNIIFEKILFQCENEYSKVAELLKVREINAWVNCPRRIYPAFKKIKLLLAKETNIQMSVSGINWGMACNSIHYIDLFANLTGDISYELDSSALENSVISSKR